MSDTSSDSDVSVGEGPPAASATCASSKVGDTFDFSSSSEDDDDAGQRRDSGRSSSKGRRAGGSRTANQGPAAAASANGSPQVRTRSMQTLNGPVTITDSVVAAAPEADWSEVNISYYLSASMSDLATGRVKPVMKLAAGAMAIFDENHETRSKDHICGGVFITEVRSDFPGTMHLDVEGVSAAPGCKSVTHDGSRGQFTITPRMAFSSEAGVLIAASNSAKVEQMMFLKQYPGWNLGNIHVGVQEVADAQGKIVAMIDKNHPVVAYFNAARDKAGVGPLQDKDLMEGTNFYLASPDDARTCMSSLKASMRDRLQIQNLYDVGLRLRRARASVDAPLEGDDAPAEGDDVDRTWISPEEVLDGMTRATAPNHVMNAQHKIYVTAKILYREL